MKYEYVVIRILLEFFEKKKCFFLFGFSHFIFFIFLDRDVNETNKEEEEEENNKKEI